MNRDCARFIEQLADTLGNPSPAEPSPELVEHLAACRDCRRVYDDARAGLAALRELPEPAELTIHIGDDRVVVPLPRSTRRSAPRFAALARYAAVILLAFSAGFLARSWAPTTGPAGDDRSVTRLVDTRPADSPSDSLRTALMQAHRRNPGTSDLAKLLMAVAPARR